MTVRKMITTLFAALGMLVLILDGETALAGASAGVELCLKTVIPSLFPFLFLCSLMTETLWGERFPILMQIGKMTGIPKGAESLLIVASLGGYPAGAQTIGQAYRENRLSRTDAEHLLTFCSNAGPAFLFGMIAQQFPEKKTPWLLLIIHLFSALVTGILLPCGDKQQASLSPKTASASQYLAQCVRTMGVICGWIILFRILTDFMTRWIFWYFSEDVQVILSGFLELSNGCCMLSQIQDASLRFLICSGFLSFGGLCITMQTTSVIGGLSLKPYLQGKLLQTLFSLLLSAFYLNLGLKELLLLCTGILFAIAAVKKVVDFRKHSVYNEGINIERNQSHAVS